MNHKNQFSRKNIPHCSTPKNVSINSIPKSINYNLNNNNNFYNSNLNLSNNFVKESEYNSDNSSDINFYSSSSSLKDQILSPGDDDLYLYLNTNKNANKKNKANIYPSNNKTNDFDSTYYLNFDVNTTNFKSIENNNKKTLILDLDETLVHSSFHPLYFEGELIRPDIFFTILFENKTHDVYVLKRPYIKEFINKMSKIYNIYIFTASIKEYANPLLLKLDENKLISKKLFRENCTLSKDNKFIKDLHILDEDLKNVILIDNNPNSYRYNKCNGIPIKTWHYDKSDKELIKIIPFLTFLALVDDVREYIPKVVDDDQINYNKVKNIINNSTINNIIKKDTTNNNNKNKRIINKIKKHKIINNHSYNNNNCNSNRINNNYSNSSGKINYYPSYTNNEESKFNASGNKNKKNENISSNKNNAIENENDEKNENYFLNEQINFNRLEERKNNNYNTVLNNNRKNFHSPATINFREPISHFQSSIFVSNNNQTNMPNNMILSNGNINNRNDEYDINKYQRSKSSNNFNELTKTIHKFSSINFNLMNSQSNANAKKMKFGGGFDYKNNNQNNKSNDIHKIYENKNMTEKCLSYNNLMNNRVNFSKLENSFYLENNDPILVTYIQNNNINFNTNNNIMSINLKDEESPNKQLLYNDIKENKTQRIVNNYNKLVNKYKYAPNNNNNLFSNKNVLYKKRLNNNKVRILDNKKDSIKYAGEEDPYSNIKPKKYNNFRNKKIKKIKNNSFRNNNDFNYNKKNYNKNILISRTNDFKNKNNNNDNNNFDSINDKNYIDNINNNEINFNKKLRSQTLNSNHRLHTKIEENKNSTMEIPKNIKKKFYNNCLKDNSHHKEYKHNHSVKNKNSTINYNTNKQKIHKENLNRNNDLNNEINLLNDFMKDFNRDQKEISYFSNYQNISKEINSQRVNKLNNKKKNISTLINYNYNTEKYMNTKIKNKKLEEEKEKNFSKNEFFNKKNMGYCFEKENFYTNFYKRKNRPYIISKETNNYIKKKMNNINLDDDYNNDIKIDNNESDSIKNIKFFSLQKDKSVDKNEKILQRMKISNEKININKNGKSKAVYYSYGGKKNMKKLLGDRTINN